MIKSIVLVFPTYVISSFLIPLDIVINLQGPWHACGRPWNFLRRGGGEGGFTGSVWRNYAVQNMDVALEIIWSASLIFNCWENSCGSLYNSQSLLARVFRGMYYKLNSPFLSSPLVNPSHIWTSISVAKPLLALRIKKKVNLPLRLNIRNIFGFQQPLWGQPGKMFMLFTPHWQ